MATVLKRLLIVMVPTLIVLLMTWLAPFLILHGRISGAAYWLLDYGVPMLLVAMTAWISARYGGLRRRAAASAGALVVLFGKVVPLLVLCTVLAARSGDWDGVASICFLGGLLMLMALPLAYIGAWIATRARPKPQRA